MIELYERVALTRDIPTEGLRKGDVAYLLERIPHSHGGEPGCVLEVFNAIGESLRVVAVPESAVAALRADEVLAVRTYA
ncbi:MAG: DUF4926 domain-containing protein [Synechococcaceae cyanobacterium SM2_3_2]|nr:DUF4926 domain-containing protein [Synechococcaceae cyanobacterium SM2_3_2]